MKCQIGTAHGMESRIARAGRNRRLSPLVRDSCPEKAGQLLRHILRHADTDIVEREMTSDDDPLHPPTAQATSAGDWDASTSGFTGAELADHFGITQAKTLGD